MNDESQNEGQKCLDGYNQNHVVEVVAKGKSKIVSAKPVGHQQGFVVRKPDALGLQRWSDPAPIGEAHPERHEDRQHDEGNQTDGERG